MSERTELQRPLTPQQERVVELLAEGLTYREVGERLKISVYTVERHCENAGAKVPGDLPLQLRLVSWYRGQPLWRLTGGP